MRVEKVARPTDIGWEQHGTIGCHRVFGPAWDKYERHCWEINETTNGLDEWMYWEQKK